MLIVRKVLLPGGCALNTCRALSWLDADDNTEVMLVGSVGSDENRVELENIIKADGIKPRFSVHPTLPTGHCVALVCGMERTMCANVGAADEYSAEDYDRMKMEHTIGKADIVYLTRFVEISVS